MAQEIDLTRPFHPLSRRIRVELEGYDSLIIGTSPGVPLGSYLGMAETLLGGGGYGVCNLSRMGDRYEIIEFDQEASPPCIKARFRCQ